MFNDPRKVVGWTKSDMHPGGLTESGFELPNKVSYSEEELFFIEEFLHDGNDDFPDTYLGGYPIFVQGDNSPSGYKLLLEMAEGEASTNMWSDAGTCQVWMSVGDDFGGFVMQYECC